MKIFFVLFSLLVSVATYAQPPKAANVYLAILRDSGLSNITEVVERQIHESSSGIFKETWHTVNFVRAGQEYHCEAARFTTWEIKPGQYYVSAYVADCKGPNGTAFRLKNDYTTKQGASFFRRIFYDHNSKFRNITDEDDDLITAEMDREDPPEPVASELK